MIVFGTLLIVARDQLPTGRYPIPSRCVYRNKLADGGVVARQKTRLVAKGYRQQQGIDYAKTFASVIRHNTLRMLLALAAARGWTIRQLDIATAFLNAGRRTRYLHVSV